MQPVAIPTARASDMAWRRRSPALPARPHLPDTQNILIRLDVVVDRLEGAYERWERLVPMLEQFSESLRQRGGE